MGRDDDEDSSASSSVSEEDLYFLGDDMDNCLLSADDMKLFTTPRTDKWQDFHPKDYPDIVTIDESKDKQWSLAKKEIEHVRKRVREMIDLDDVEEMDTDEIVREIALLFVGSQSRIGKFFQENLSLSAEKYVGFFHTICLQAAYDLTSDQLYHPISKLRDDALLTQEDYVAVWSWMAHRRCVEEAAISTSRRSIPLWEQLEQIFNEIHRSISVEDRDGRISIALDDDKVSFLCFVLLFTFGSSKF